MWGKKERIKTTDMFYKTKNNFINYKLNDDFDIYGSKFSR